MTPPALHTSKTDEAIELCRAILVDFDKGLAVSKIALKTAHLGRLLDDEFIQTYVAKCMEGVPQGQNWLTTALKTIRSEGTTAKSSGTVRFLDDFRTTGPTIPGYLAGGSKSATFTFLPQSLPDAEIYVASGRKKADYTYKYEDLMKGIERAEGVIGRVSTRLHRYVSTTYLRLRFGNIPESIFLTTRRSVDSLLSTQCPQALERFATAYEELAKNSEENWTNATLAIRRVLEAFADSVYPAREGQVDGHPVGQADYINRLWAYAGDQIKSSSQKRIALAEVTDLGKRLDAIYAQSNKGIHATVTRAEADRIVIRAYLLIADLLNV